MLDSWVEDPESLLQVQEAAICSVISTRKNNCSLSSPTYRSRSRFKPQCGVPKKSTCFSMRNDQFSMMCSDTPFFQTLHLDPQMDCLFVPNDLTSTAQTPCTCWVTYLCCVCWLNLSKLHYFVAANLGPIPVHLHRIRGRSNFMRCAMAMTSMVFSI